MRTLLVSLAVLEIGLPLCLYLFRHRLMFFPDAAPEAWQGLPGIGKGVEAALVEVARSDGRRLPAYDARPAGAAAGGPVVLFLHGNAGNIAERGPLLGFFVRGTGLRTLMVEYSGFGGAGGSPTETAAVEDGVAAFDHLVAAGVPASRIVLYGESIGGAVALAVAARRKPAGVVVQSSFSSLSSMTLRVYPWIPLASLLSYGNFRSVDRIREFDAPVLVVHGEEDDLVPPAEGRALAEAAGKRGEFLSVPAAGHNDLVDTGGEAYLRTVGDRVRGW